MTLLRRAILALTLIAGIGPVIAQAPPPVPALPDSERRTSYNLSGTTCACSVGFALYGDSTDYQNWIEVFVNGVRVNYNDPNYGWTITSATGPLATIARPVNDGVLTFTHAQTGTVQIVGARRPRRTSQFAENRGVAARDQNQVITDITATLREMWDRTNDVTGRAILGLPGEVIVPLPSAAQRASSVLCWDGTGLIPMACAALNGKGNVIGPNSSTDGDIAVFSGITGQIVRDGGPIGALFSSGTATLAPNPLNSPGSAPANQIAQTGFGVPINVLTTTTGGLAEVEAQAALTGWPVHVSQLGVTSASTNPQFIGMSTTWTTHPRAIWSVDIDDATVQCSFVTSSDCIKFESAEIGRFALNGQVVYGGTGNAIHINPLTATPNDHFIVFSLNDFSVRTTVAVAGSEAAIKINPTATASLGVQQNVFNFREVNNGTVGIKVMNPSAVSGGLTPVFSHNIITATAIHGQATAGVQVGQSTTRQAQMGGNVWTALFNSSAETDAFVTYEHNSLHIVGFDPTNTLTNGLHYKSGATNNVAILLDTAGATNPIVDDNSPGGGNVIIGNGNITVGGFSIALQNSNMVFAHVEATEFELLGSSTGFTAINSANSGASNFAAVLPANSGTIAELNLAQSWSAVQSFGANDLVLSGVATGTQCLHANSSGVVTGTGSDCGAGGAGIAIGTTTITSGTTTRVLFDNAGVVGEYVISGTGNVAMTTNAVFTTPNLGTPSAVVLTSGTGLPISTGLTGAGTGILAALAVNVGTAGAPVVNGGALGSPSSAGTIPAFTLGGTVAGGGNQINNVIIGTSTPLAGFFTTLSATTSVTSPSLIGGTTTTSFLNLSGSSNGAPTADYVQITSTGATTLYMGKICGGAVGFPGFAVGNNGQADCTHYSFMGDGTNTYFNTPSGAGIMSFRINNGEFMRLFASSGLALGSTTDPGAGAFLANTSIKATTFLQTGAIAVASLPTCNAGAKAERYFVTDNNTALAFAAVITTGGAIQTPVYCDGTTWRQG